MTKLLSVLVGVGVLVGLGAAAQSKQQSLEGVWRAMEVTTATDGRTIRIPQPRPNLIIFTGRHYSRVEIHSAGPRLTLADIAKASADELRAVWGPFVGEAGTYELAGNVLTMRPTVAKDPASMASGAFIAYSYSVDGDMLSVTSQRDQNGPIVNGITVKAVRVE